MPQVSLFVPHVLLSESICKGQRRIQKILKDWAYCDPHSTPLK